MTIRSIVVDEWLTAYRGYSSSELADEITWLRTQIRNPYNAQTEGNRSYARSTSEMRTRLSAAQQVTNERANLSHIRHGRADFGGLNSEVASD